MHTHGEQTPRWRQQNSTVQRLLGQSVGWSHRGRLPSLMGQKESWQVASQHSLLEGLAHVLGVGVLSCQPALQTPSSQSCSTAIFTRPMAANSSCHSWSRAPPAPTVMTDSECLDS